MSIFNDKALKGVAEAVTKVLQQEQLKGNQHKIDANKNGKIDSQDFKILRNKKNLKEEDTGYQDRYAVKNGKAVKHNPAKGEKDEPHHVWADSAEHAVRKHAAKTAAPVKEETEQINELSTQTLSSYVKKRGSQLTGGYNDKSKVRGINKAITKVNSKKVTWQKEEVQLDEAFPSVEDAKKRMDAESKKSHDVKKVSTGTVYTKKQKDDEPKKMKESLSFSEMLELYNEHGLKVLAPIETEEMDVDGTTIEVIDADKVNGVVDTIVEEPTNDQFTKEYEDQKASFEGKKPQPKVAAGKTTGVKAMPESVELDERKLTSSEMGKREDIVKSMKKNLSGFKQRYGERAKEVMYATAAKMAKKG